MNAQIPTTLDVEIALKKIFKTAQGLELTKVDVKSGDLHRRVGGYPSNNHRMPLCYNAMRAAMRSGDEVLAAPPRGAGATLVIRYQLPRH